MFNWLTAFLKKKEKKKRFQVSQYSVRFQTHKNEVYEWEEISGDGHSMHHCPWQSCSVACVYRLWGSALHLPGKNNMWNLGLFVCNLGTQCFIFLK